MNSQNRLNAGAEYILYRIWATLQDREGIHAGSLLTCIGAFAGYACQASVRQTALRARADLGGNALNLPLVASPLSVWSLVRRAVQKSGAPLPDFEGISAHVTRTFGTNEFGVPRVPDEHRPRRLPISYLTQLWPQVLPIAQRFCRRPSQLPVLFGIALQRAIEHTKERLSPTLAASIAMECALAMSKVTLPTAMSDLFQLPPASPDITVTAKPATAPAFPEIRATRKKRAPVAEPSLFEAAAFGARMRSAKGIATMLSLAIVAVVSFSWQSHRPETAPMTARVERGLRAPAFRAPATAIEPSQPDAQFDEQSSAQPFQQTLEQPPEQPQVAEDAPLLQPDPPPEDIPQPADELALPAPTPDTSEGIIGGDGQSA